MEDELSKLHDCEKCHGKMVCVEVDLLGNTYCGYCHERVDYIGYFRNELERLKREKDNR